MVMRVVQSGRDAAGIDMTRSRRDVSLSFEGDGIHQAAVAPGRVQAAIEL
jgi:hypothetical protein